MHPRDNQILTASSTMRAVLQRAETVAKSDASVLLIGETGVGKELLADFIHQTSARSNRPLIKVELACFPHELLETELFGYERGAFTGAFNSKKGFFEVAIGGTLFLDDIDDFPVQLQAKLLRALEAREVVRVGGTVPIRIDIRLITATKVDLAELITRGAFRPDLYYRINEVPLHIPPLRQRREDILLLASSFLNRFAVNGSLVLGEDAKRALVSHSWPGNVRELRNVMRRLAILHEGEVHEEHIPELNLITLSTDRLGRRCIHCLESEGLRFEDVVGCVETHLLRNALEQADNNQVRAARLLSMSPSTFRDKLKKYKIG